MVMSVKEILSAYDYMQIEIEDAMDDFKRVLDVGVEDLDDIFRTIEREYGEREADMYWEEIRLDMRKVGELVDYFEKIVDKIESLKDVLEIIDDEGVSRDVVEVRGLKEKALGVLNAVTNAKQYTYVKQTRELEQGSSLPSEVVDMLEGYIDFAIRVMGAIDEVLEVMEDAKDTAKGLYDEIVDYY